MKNHQPQAHDELMHHGVKGMRWGVRESRSSGGGSPTFNKRLEYAKKAIAIGKKPKAIKKEARKSVISFLKKKRAESKSKNVSLKNMTDKELQDKLNRIRNEKEYKRLTQKKSKLSAVADFYKQNKPLQNLVMETIKQQGQNKRAAIDANASKLREKEIKKILEKAVEKGNGKHRK